MRECDVCQRYKYENMATPELLQPLLIPNGCWNDVSIEFIEVLPTSHGKRCYNGGGGSVK